jgi:hypothetical protein
MVHEGTNPTDGVIERARAAFQRGDNVFEYNAPATLEDAYTGARYGRPFKVVQDVKLPNQICQQGWELVSASVSQWNPSDSVYMMRFYIFRRREENLVP